MHLGRSWVRDHFQEIESYGTPDFLPPRAEPSLGAVAGSNGLGAGPSGSRSGSHPAVLRILLSGESAADAAPGPRRCGWTTPVGASQSVLLREYELILRDESGPGHRAGPGTPEVAEGPRAARDFARIALSRRDGGHPSE